MQHQILINIIIFVAYVLNLPLNTQRSHSRSQRAGKWSLILAHDRRPIYRAPTYIAVPLLGPHQPRYIGLTLYIYLRNGRTSWHGTKGIRVDRMLDSHCDLEIWPQPWPWPSIFKVSFWNSCVWGTGGLINMERKGYEWIGCYTNYVTLSYDFDLGFWR